MRFTKMHGLGNDYVYVNCFEQDVPDPAGTAETVSDRHFGIGGDGLILILPSEKADVRMRMFNADGSEGEMCGNGVRCVAKYAFDHGLTQSNPLTVETLAGVKSIDLVLNDSDKVAEATVDMGKPILEPSRIPVNIPQKTAVDLPLRTPKNAYQMTCVGMGNPHVVIYVPDVAAVPLEQVGPEIETHPLFPQRTNVHFVEVVSDEEATVRTWERGSGMTLACGTGASAVCVAGVLTGKTGRELLTHLPGGDLKLQWDEPGGSVFMTGPAVEVFEGVWPG